MENNRIIKKKKLFDSGDCGSMIVCLSDDNNDDSIPNVVDMLKSEMNDKELQGLGCGPGIDAIQKLLGYKQQTSITGTQDVIKRYEHKCINSYAFGLPFSEYNG